MGENYLIHYGIEGQKWGKQNGPPYPLNPTKDYSAAEKKAAVKKYKSAKAAYKAKKSEYKMKKQEIKRLKALKAQMKQGPEAMAGAATDTYGNTYTMKVEKGSKAAKRLAETSYKLTKAQLKNAKAEKKVIKEEKNKLKKELKDAKAQLNAIKESMRKNGASEEEIKKLTNSAEEKIEKAEKNINHSSFNITFSNDDVLEHVGVKGMKWKNHQYKTKVNSSNGKIYSTGSGGTSLNDTINSGIDKILWLSKEDKDVIKFRGDNLFTSADQIADKNYRKMAEAAYGEYMSKCKKFGTSAKKREQYYKEAVNKIQSYKRAAMSAKREMAHSTFAIHFSERDSLEHDGVKDIKRMDKKSDKSSLAKQLYSNIKYKNKN